MITPRCECLAPEFRLWPRTGLNSPKLSSISASQSRSRTRGSAKGSSVVKHSRACETTTLKTSKKSVGELERLIQFPDRDNLTSRREPSISLVPSELSKLDDNVLRQEKDPRSLGSFVFQLAAICGFFILAAAPEASAFTTEQGAANFGGIDEIKNGFTSAFLLIFFSELGDKTFFIAAILATRKSNFAVFTGTFGALVAMTLISVTLGRAFHYIDGILPFSLGNTEIPVDDLAAVVLLVYFGVSTLLDAASMEGSKADEEQQEAELAVAGVNAGGNRMSNVVAATFALVFVAEWGDKSFFSTIALAAASSPVGVVAGAIAGHGAATVIAVLGGSFLGNYISEKVIAYIGGSLFLVFAADTLFEIFSGK